MNEKRPISQALNHVLAYQGAKAKLARQLNVSNEAVSKWTRRGVTAERAKEISKITGIPLAKLRPDIWG